MDIKRQDLGNGICIFAPDAAKSVITEIWTQGVYNRKYKIIHGDIVVDIGANIGIFSIFAAYCGATVYAYEPNPMTFEILLKNIQENGFSDRITAFNQAVACSDGTLELFVPVSDKMYSLGSATAADKMKNDLEKNKNIEFLTYSVEAVSVNTIFRSYGKKVIDFLKVDCEGMEYSIFAALEDEYDEMIMNLAVETHLGYSEKEMVSLLNRKGFYINEYSKRDHILKTGYCYATRHNQQDVISHVEPVAIITSADFCQAGENTEISVLESFCVNDASCPFEVTWVIDGEKKLQNEISFTHIFHDAGVHRISCEIVKSGRRDTDEKKIVVLSANYVSGNPIIKLFPCGEINLVSVDLITSFLIEKNRISELSDLGDLDKIIVGIRVKDEKIREFSPHVISNGKISYLAGPYTEIEIDSICPGLDVYFDLELGIKSDVEIFWCIKRCSEDSCAEISIDCDGAVLLRSSSADLFLTVDGKVDIKIRKDRFPSSWFPRFFKIGISAVSDDGRAKKLTGKFLCQNKTTILDGWYTEITINDFDCSDDLKMTLDIIEKNDLKIVWWAE